jgi:hypothetical protein
MANIVSGNPWTLTTAGVIANWKVKIKNLLWTNGATGNILIIQDNDGRDIIRDTWADNIDHNYGEFSYVAGFHLVQIDGGEVTVVVGGK